MKRIITAIILVFFLFTLPLSANFQKAQSVIRKATVFIVVLPENTVAAGLTTITQLKSKRMLTSGTGFIISKNGLVLTAAHVIGKRSKIFVVVGDRYVYPATVIMRTYNSKKLARDYALLKIRASHGFPFLTLGDSSKLDSNTAPGLQVAHLGYIFSTSIKGIQLNADFNLGTISAIKEIFGMKMIQHNIPSNPGNSGSPMFNNKGEVIGLVNAGIKGGQNINFAIPVETIKESIKKAVHGNRAGNIPFSRTLALAERLLTVTSLKINVFPDGALAYLDENFIGVTPCSVNLLPGKHTLRILKNGYNPFLKKITATSGMNAIGGKMIRNSDYSILSTPAFYFNLPRSELETYKAAPDTVADIRDEWKLLLHPQIRSLNTGNKKSFFPLTLGIEIPLINNSKNDGYALNLGYIPVYFTGCFFPEEILLSSFDSFGPSRIKSVYSLKTGFAFRIYIFSFLFINPSLFLNQSLITAEETATGTGKTKYQIIVEPEIRLGLDFGKLTVAFSYSFQTGMLDNDGFGLAFGYKM